MIKLRNVQVRGDAPHGLLITWTIGDTSEDLSLYSFVVLRSGGPAGPFSPISPEINNSLSFFDQQADQAKRRRMLFYRVRVIKHGPIAETIDYPEDDSVYLSAPQDLVAQELTFRFGAQLYIHSGRRALIFPAKHEGARCPCFNGARSRSSRSNCPTCFGNTYAGGFWSPVLVPVKFFEGSSLSGPTPSGKSGLFHLGVYPRIRKGDLFVEAEGRRWRVPDTTSIRILRHNRAPYQQHIEVVEVPAQDVVYTIPASFEGVEVAPEARFLRRMH